MLMGGLGTNGQCADYAQKNLHRRIGMAFAKNGGGAAAAAAAGATTAAVHKAMEEGLSELDHAFLHVARRQVCVCERERVCVCVSEE
jgi:hypothetical protein